MLYQSMKLTNGIWVLAELRVQAGNPNYTVSTEPAILTEFMSLNHITSGGALLTVYY